VVDTLLSCAHNFAVDMLSKFAFLLMHFTADSMLQDLLSITAGACCNYFSLIMLLHLSMSLLHAIVLLAYFVKWKSAKH